MDSNPTLAKMKQIVSSARLGRLFSLAIGAVFILIIVAWFISVSRRDAANCSNMNTLYKDFPTISTINPDSSDYEHNLRDYYVKTAYNACSAGAYKNDFVNVCALKDCIRQGARCIDLEIYSVDDQPVIATSAVNDFTVKETYNSVPFDKALEVINNYAFSGSSCPNPGDPLILHLRIMSENKKIYQTMADAIAANLETRVLGPKYSYENHGKNIGQEPLKNLMGKVLIIVDKTNPLFESTPLDEYVNIASNSVFMRALRYTQGVKYTQDMESLIDFNKKNMTICLPDLSPSPTNPSAALAMNYGCQMVAMSFQDFDSNMEHYDQMFDKNGTAFILKPKALRYIPLTIAAPQKQNPKYSYKPRQVSSDYYSFTV